MSNKYSGKVEVDVENKSISASLKLDYLVKNVDISNISFYLPSETHNIRVTSDKIKNVNVKTVKDWCPLVYGDTQITIEFNKTFTREDIITLQFEYTSDLSSITSGGMNVFSEELIELGVYTPWFPLTENFEEAIFNVEIDINDEHVLVGGNVRNKNGGWLLEQQVPHVCCTILASKRFKENYYNNDFSNILTNVYWVSEKNEVIATTVNENIREIIELYLETFGYIDAKKIDFVVVPRENSESSGGYCRPGLIVLPGKQSEDTHWKYQSNSKDYMFKYLAHELAHMWWSKADVSTWENWLNESFAEYSSLMAIRELKSNSQFIELIEKYKKKCTDIISIKNCTKESKDSFDVWYVKGPVILNQLENKLGELRFKNLCKIIHTEKLRTTDDIIERIKVIEGDELANYLSMLISK